MANKNKHLIRHRANGYGKKWRPSPNDPAFEPPKQRPPIIWKSSVADVFRKESK